MTKKEALSVLKNAAFLGTEEDAAKVTEAIDTIEGTVAASHIVHDSGKDADCISRQAAIDAICQSWCGCDNKDCRNPFNPETDEYYYCDGCGDIEVLKDLPAVDAPRWIPCRDRLPDKDGDYLVTYEKGYAEDYGFSDIGIAPFEVDCEGFGIWQEHFHPVSLGSLGSEWVEIQVTAWLPLPEPYKEEEDGTAD